MLKEIVLQVNEMFNKNDIEGFLSHCTDDVVWFMSGTVFTGKAGVRGAFSRMPDTAPRIVIDHIIAADNTVMAEGRFELKNNDGSIYKAIYCDVYRFETNKINRLNSYVVEVK